MELKIEIFYGFISTMRYTNLMAVSSLDLLSLSLHADPARYCLSKSHILNIRLRLLRRPEKPNNDAIFCRINNFQDTWTKRISSVRVIIPRNMAKPSHMRKLLPVKWTGVVLKYFGKRIQSIFRMSQFLVTFF